MSTKYILAFSWRQTPGSFPKEPSFSFLQGGYHEGADDHFHLHRVAETLEVKIAGAKRTLIPETRHMPDMEKPEEFNRIVLDFLSVQ